MKTLIKNGNLYAKIPLAELTKRNRMELTASNPFKKQNLEHLLDWNNISGLGNLADELQKLAKDHNKKVIQKINKFAKEHEDDVYPLGISVNKFADHIGHRFYNEYMVRNKYV